MTCYRKSGSTLDRTMKAYLWIALINSGLHNERDQEGKRPRRTLKLYYFFQKKLLCETNGLFWANILLAVITLYQL